MGFWRAGWSGKNYGGSFPNLCPVPSREGRHLSWTAGVVWIGNGLRKSGGEGWRRGRLAKADAGH